MHQIILASASPRRKELLRQLIGDNFLVYPSYYEEPQYSDLSHEELLLKHSVEKARSTAKHFDVGLVISADTSVIYNGEIIGKPQSPEKAEEMLTKLSGQRFKVVTGLTVLDLSTEREISESETTFVWMAKISKKQISAYIRKENLSTKPELLLLRGKEQSS